MPVGVATRERRLLLAFVALAHVAGATLLARLDATTEPKLDTPITVALIQAPSVGPETATDPEPTAAVEPPPVVQAPPEPPPPARTPIDPPPPPPAVQPEPPPPPIATPEPPRPRPQPAPRKQEAKPKPPVEPRPLVESPPAVHTPAQVAAPTRPQTIPAPVAAAGSSPVAAPVTAARFDAAYLNTPPPTAPRGSRRMREEGRVLLRVFVTSEGRPGRIELSESSGSTRLDQAAETAVASWRFIPAKQGEHAIDAWVIVPIVFKLEG